MQLVVGLAEIVLWTADKTAALSFYRDLPDLKVILSPTLPNVFLKSNEGRAGIPQMIVLVPKTKEIKARSSGYQLKHLAFELASEKFDTQHNRLIQAGYQPCDSKDLVFASRTMHIDDPDGNEVEFICHTFNQ